MVEPIRKMTVDNQGWLRQAEFLDGLALCQLLPGATVVQLGTYVGYRLRRVAGALVAAAAFILPAFLMMLVLSFFTLRIPISPGCRPSPGGWVQWSSLSCCKPYGG